MRRQQTARAVRFHEFGGVDVLQIDEVEMPTAGSGEVVVEVITTGINHIEAFIRAGTLGDDTPTTLPGRQGSDFAGIICEVGHGVTGFRRGDEVLGHVERGAQATHLAVPVENLVKKPAALTWEVAGGLFLAGYVALETLDQLHLGDGDTLVVSAAAGGVGSMEVQLAKAQGVRVIGTCGKRNFDYLRQIGITPVLYGPGIVDRIRAVAPDGVTAYIDNFGQDGQEIADELGVDPGRYRSSEHRRELELAALTVADDESRRHRTAQLERLAGLAGKRTMNVLISGLYPFDDVRYAFDDLERMHARGKIVLGTRPVTAYTMEKARDQRDESDDAVEAARREQDESSGD